MQNAVTINQVQALETLAKHATSSKFFNNLGGQAGIFCIAMYAQELGLPPMQCLFGGMNNIQGKIELSPRLMNSMIRKAGHKVEVLICDANQCELKGTRADTKETLKVGFSIEDAKRAGIYKAGGAWTKYPDDMCFKSALSKLARRLFADVISTAYIEGEIDSDRSAKQFPAQEDESQEAEVEPIAELKSETLISGEECEFLHSKIPPQDREYHGELMRFFKLKLGLEQCEDFTDIPAKHLAQIQDAINKRNEKLLAEETAVN